MKFSENADYIENYDYEMPPKWSKIKIIKIRKGIQKITNFSTEYSSLNLAKSKLEIP